MQNCTLCKRKLGKLNFQYHSIERNVVCAKCLRNGGYGFFSTYKNISQIPLEIIMSQTSSYRYAHKKCEICYKKTNMWNKGYETSDGKFLDEGCLKKYGFPSVQSAEEIKNQKLYIQKLTLEDIIFESKKAIRERNVKSIKVKIDSAGDTQKKNVTTINVCPNCKNTNIQFMQNNKKNFSVGKAAAGTVLTGGIGLLAGFAGKKGKNQWHCNNCGNTFETK